MRFSPVFAAAFLLLGCSKIPESDAAKKVGEQPKQVIDKASADVGRALQQGEDARRAAEERK
jgi:hypothetical protein